MPVNKTRVGNNFQKKAMSVAWFKADYSDIIADSGNGTIFFVMPVDSILIHIGLVEETPANTGANATITAGAQTLVTNGALDVSGIYTLTPKHLDGGDVIVKQGSTPPTQGTFSFFVLYIEHEKTTGEYTRFSDNG